MDAAFNVVPIVISAFGLALQNFIRSISSLNCIISIGSLIFVGVDFQRLLHVGFSDVDSRGICWEIKDSVVGTFSAMIGS